MHAPGIKNEWCDWLSHASFDETINVEFENLAKLAFEKMDSQLDLHLQVLSMEMRDFNFPLDYLSSEFSSQWSQLNPWKAKVIDEEGQFVL